MNILDMNSAEQLSILEEQNRKIEKLHKDLDNLREVNLSLSLKIDLLLTTLVGDKFVNKNSVSDYSISGRIWDFYVNINGDNVKTLRGLFLLEEKKLLEFLKGIHVTDSRFYIVNHAIKSLSKLRRSLKKEVSVENFKKKCRSYYNEVSNMLKEYDSLEKSLIDSKDVFSGFIRNSVGFRDAVTSSK